MKKKLLDILVCPICKSELKLTVESEKGDEILIGSMYCSKCRVNYPIVDSIPHLLPPEKKA